MKINNGQNSDKLAPHVIKVCKKSKLNNNFKI